MRLMRALKVAAVLAAVALMPVAAFIAAPLPPHLLDYRSVASVRVLDREGGLLRELKSAHDGRGTPLNAEQIPPHVTAAFLAAEDRGFFSHLGVSPSAFVRAAWQNVSAGRVVSGGSTITMQLARTLVPRERTLIGKLQESLWALRLEAHLNKREILTQYLNRISFGNNAFGLEAASQMYFARRAEHLSLGQAAALAAVPRGPTAYNPYRKPAKLEARRQWVLSRLVATGLAPADDVARARDPGALDLSAFSNTFRAPHFVDYIARSLPQWGLADAAVIETTLDPGLQTEVEEQVAQEISRLSERRVGSAAVLVLDNASGEVLAYLGSADFFDEAAGGQNDGVQMHRQPGSALKPFVYAEAFTKGFTPASVIADLETHFGGRKGAYAPKNYDKKTHGPVRAREALANSYNVPAVRLTDAIGVNVALATLQRAGFESLDKGTEHYGLGLALGNGEVSLWHLARAYAGLSRGGVLEPLKVVKRALRADGSEMALPKELAARRFADPRAAALVTHILSDNAARARAFGLDNALRLPFEAAAKTGTSKGYSDNWAVGYTKERTVAVWAGNFDGTPMIQVSGITGAGPVYKRVMTRAMRSVVAAALVDSRGLEQARICPLSGARAGPSCPAAMNEFFIPGTAPAHDCAMHGAVSERLPKELHRQCEALAAQSGRVTDLGIDYYDWAARQGLLDEPWLAPSCTGAGHAGAVSLLSPASGDEYMLFDDLPLADQAIPLRVRAEPGMGALQVRIDGEAALELKAPYVSRIAARKGRHVLSLHRADGAEVARADFVVRTESRW